MASTQDSNIHVGSAADELPPATTQAPEASSTTHRAGADGTQEVAAPLNAQPDDNIFALKYDYLGKVKSLCSGIDPQLFDNFFVKHFRPNQCMAHIFNGENMGYDGVWEAVRDPTEHTWMFRSAFLLANLGQPPYILIVENINEHAAQELGSLLDLDPCFLAQHLGTAETMACPPLELRNLRRNFFSPATIEDRCSAHQVGVLEYRADYEQNLQQHSGLRSVVDAADDVSGIVSGWPLAGTDRIENRSTSVTLNTRLSCCQVEAHGWLILVDGPTPPDKKLSRYGPFSEKNRMLFRRSSAQLPLHVHNKPWDHPTATTVQYHLFELLKTMFLERKPLKDGNSIRDVLFTNTPAWTTYFPTIFPHLLTASVWTTNMKSLEERLRELRYDTTIDPEMASFNQLTLLRRNIGDMHTALLDAQERITATEALMLRTLQRDCGISLSQQDSLEGIFDTLLARNGALSMAVDHEIQLVIASVTVQEAAISKEQNRRAAKLTLLAAVYLPLTLVTGVFGMNIKEINDGAPQFWVCLLGLVVVGGFTLAGFFGYQRLQHGREVARKKAKAGDDGLYKLA